MIGRYLAARETAAARGDRGLVNEIDFQLARFGYQPDSDPAAAEENADRAARPAGRPSARRSND